MAHARNKSRRTKKRITVEGNLALKETKVVKKKTSSRKRVRENKFLQMSRGYAFFVGAATILIAAIGILDVSLYIDVHNANVLINKEESRLESLREDNAILSEKLTEVIPLDEIKKKAKEEFGMANVRKDQVIKFRNEADDYMEVYSTTSQKKRR